MWRTLGRGIENFSFFLKKSRIGFQKMISAILFSIRFPFSIFLHYSGIIVKMVRVQHFIILRLWLVLIIYSYFHDVRSSRQIGTKCRYDVGYRIVTWNTRPDHITISRFIKKKSSFCHHSKNNIEFIAGMTIL